MKYSKNEAKEAAKELLQGVWTALPTNFTPDGAVDEAAMAWNLEYCISDLQLAGHYCHGNVAEFWTLDNEERMRIHELNVDVAKGRVPLIAGCGHGVTHSFHFRHRAVRPACLHSVASVQTRLRSHSASND